MNFFDEYQKFVKSTLVVPEEHVFAYLVLGLISELGEFSEEHDTDELGDVLWYMASLSNFLGISFRDDVLSPGYDSVYWTDWLMLMADMAGVAKKILRGDKDRHPEQLLPFLIEVASNLVGDMDDVDDVIPVLERNRDKLSSRKARGVLKGSGDHR